MDHTAPPSVPEDNRPKLCSLPQSMLREYCDKIIYQHDADSTNDSDGHDSSSDLKRLDTLIAHLILKRSDFNREINRHNSPIMQKLPQDVIAVVFSFCSPDYTEFYTSLSKYDLSAPLILGAVCKDWREIAWSNPRFWSTMAINISSSKTIFESQTSLAREWLSRSGRLPLSIRIVWKQYDPTLRPAFLNFLAVANEKSSRWHTLHISVSPEIYSTFGGSKLKTPILESLHFHSDVFKPNGKTSFLLRHCPRLREIRVTNVPVLWIKVPRNTISQIYISGRPIRECRKLIGTSPLVHCVLTDIGPGADRNPLSTNLKHLAIQVDHGGDVVSDFFYEMTAPCLETLSFTTAVIVYNSFPVVDTLRSFLVRSACSLQTFSLDGARFTLDGMMGLLEAMPTLKILTVSLWDYDTRTETEIMLAVLARVITSQGKSTRQGFLYNLETFTFTGYVNFRPRKVPYINPIGPLTPYYTPQRSLYSVTLNFHIPEHLPEQTISFLLTLKGYGITVKVSANDTMEDLLQPAIDFYKSTLQSIDCIEDLDLSLLDFEGWLKYVVRLPSLIWCPSDTCAFLLPRFCLWVANHSDLCANSA